MKKIVLITTGQPATNPRIVKEADALQAAGFDVTVLYSYFIEWAAKADETLLKRVAWKYKMIGGSAFILKPLYLFTRIRFKISGILNRYVGNGFLIGERSQARCYDELLRIAKNIRADYYVGHNLGALAVCCKAARFNNAKAVFDFEDYYRGENDQAPLYEKNRIRFLENKYVPWLDHISTASPLITKMITADFPFYNKKISTVLNCFPVSQQPAFREKQAADNNLKLFWFSQTVGKNRGIEIVVDAIRLMNDKSIQLTLAGRPDAGMEQYFDQLDNSIRDQIHFAGIIQPEQLPEFASAFDIGLALETGFSINNNIALSNKIFTYLLAGNAIIFSKTAMQDAFNKQYKLGETFTVGNRDELIQNIKSYQNKETLNKQKQHNYTLAASHLNWEKESEKLLAYFQQPGNN